VTPALAIIRKFLRQIPSTAVDANCLHCLELSQRCGNEGEFADEDIVIRPGTPLDLQGMIECQNFPERLRERFAEGERCVVAAVGDRIVGYQWFCDKPWRIEERYGYRVDIPADAIYGYDAFVVPRYRRARIWTRFHTVCVNEFLRQLHRCKIIAMVDEGNTVSMNAHLRLGYKLYRKVYVLKVLGKSFYFVKAVNADARRLTVVTQADRVSVS
jgi:GNAT superfamily N-acetyltransferase